MALVEVAAGLIANIPHPCDWADAGQFQYHLIAATSPYTGTGRLHGSYPASGIFAIAATNGQQISHSPAFLLLCQLVDSIACSRNKNKDSTLATVAKQPRL